MAVVVTEYDATLNVLRTEDGLAWPITNLFDGQGLPTVVAADAVICIAGWPGKWLSLVLEPFDPRRLQ